jgi:hypothetical protein
MGLSSYLTYDIRTGLWLPFFRIFEGWGQPVLENNIHSAEDRENISRDKQPALENNIHVVLKTERSSSRDK